MPSPQMHLRRARPTVPPTVGRSSLARGDAAARLLRALCVLLAMLILVGPRHVETGQNHIHGTAVAQATAASHLDHDAVDRALDKAIDDDAEHAHGADTPLAPQGQVPMATAMTTDTTVSTFASTYPAQAGPRAPTPPPRSVQAPAFLVA